MMKRALSLILPIAAAGWLTHATAKEASEQAALTSTAVDYALSFQPHRKALEERILTAQNPSLRLRYFAGLYGLSQREKDLKTALQEKVAVFKKDLTTPSAVTALARLYEFSGDPPSLDRAIRIAQLLKESKEPQANAALGEAYLSLYRVTADRSWLEKAKTIGMSMKESKSEPEAVRFLNLLYHHTGASDFRKAAQTSFLALKHREAIDAFLAGWELDHDPIHITIVGPKSDPAAKALFEAALRYPSIYKRLEWWDKKEGPMPNPDVQYPQLEKPAAFACSKKSCSLPILNPKELASSVRRLTSQ